MQKSHSEKDNMIKDEDIPCRITDTMKIIDGGSVAFGVPVKEKGRVVVNHVLNRDGTKVFGQIDGRKSVRDLAVQLENNSKRSVPIPMFMETLKYFLNDLVRKGLIYIIPHEVSEVLESMDSPPPKVIHPQKKPQRILFIVPQSSMSLSSPKPVTTNSAPPLGLLWLASVLKAEGVEVILEDFSAEFIRQVDVDAMLKEHRPDVVGISSLSPQAPWALWLIKQIKENMPTLPIVVGGVHATVLPKDFLDRGADFVVQGEGEETLLELWKAWVEGTDPQGIPGLVGRDFVGSARLPIRNLDKLPFPDRTLVNLKRYHHQGSIITSRGCKNACFWCRNIFQNIRFRSIDNVVAEMDLLFQRYGVTTFEIQDDLFTASLKRAREFAIAIKDKGYKWGIHTTVNDIVADLGLFREMHEAGLRIVLVGVESGDPETMSALRKTPGPEQTLEALCKLRDIGVKVSASFIIGLPDDTEERVIATRDLAVKLRQEGIDVKMNVLNAFPGTPLHQNPEAYGITIHDKSPNRLLYRAVNISTRHLSRERLRKWFGDILYELACMDDPTLQKKGARSQNG